jgi:hypothetical protein
MNRDRPTCENVQAVQADADARCADCGCFGAYHFDGHTICADCREQRGACCAELRRDEPDSA